MILREAAKIDLEIIVNKPIRDKNQPVWQDGSIAAGDRQIPRVSSRLTWQDTLGSWRARWGMGRMHYRIPPGLYALGSPDDQSPVMVSANYKMSFDRLRQALAGQNAWLVVLDTRGINVWCAAGKGTFGTAEIIQRISDVRLGEVVAHRRLILPQLGTPGVTMREVTAQTGFQPICGPVLARDIPAYLAAGMSATPAMRRVQFPLLDRLVLTPMEIVGSLKFLAAVIAFFFVLALISPLPMAWSRIIRETWSHSLPFFGAALTGAVAVPILLPWIPGPSFAWKGWLAGFFWFLLLVVSGYFLQTGWLIIGGMFCLLPALSAWLAFNFTGCTTYTSLSGVDKEMRAVLPLLLAAAGAGLLLLILDKTLLFF